MSVLKEVPPQAVPSGLRLKRKLGDKIVIRHQGETLVLQVIAFHSGWQVVIAFEDSERKFEIAREEVAHVSMG